MPNRLSGSLSPYLEQHADNPVDWYPWSPEALDAARAQDKPIVLSIGYSACHWCHVMAHESFEDPAIAGRMNQGFINIKVDREERPDLDRIYQLAHQLLSGRGGGWPLTLFLDPADQTPFVAGTYFPPEARHGLIGFAELLERVHDAWINQREALAAQNRQLREALLMVSAQHTEKDPQAGSAEDLLIGQLSARLDRRHGGFGDAPKFPQAPLLEWLLARAEDDPQAAEMLNDTLKPMAVNGLFDHLGGGFFRYSVDAAWEIPHFEKMLYDSALLLPIYAEAAQRWNDDDLRYATERTVEFLCRDLGLAEGGFASSLDADSVPADLEPGQPASPREGAHYLWTPAQFDDCLGDRSAGHVDSDQAAVERAQARFGLDGPPNFEQSSWHLVIARTLNELTTRADQADPVAVSLEQARQKLLACRMRRPMPGRDDKMLASWNALTVIGLARAARALDRPEWAQLACDTHAIVWQRLFDDDQVHAVWRDGRRAHPALLNDFASMLLACLETLACRWNTEWLDRADWLAGQIRDRFSDFGSGTLFLTPADHEALIMRPTANTDDATPAGAALAARGLLRLGHLTANPEWLELAGRALDSAAGDIQRSPMAHASLMLAAAEYARPVAQVLIGGTGPLADQWFAELSRRVNLHCYRIVSDEPDLPGPLADLARAERDIAVVCIGNRCLAPAHNAAQLERRLAEAGR
ncbi:MAG: thioredoxin domain-containing protein [Xanthomonadaceae bacterium]|nr:thioredoxin domain-containing protein [Xanthomonadaceae bacterium]